MSALLSDWQILRTLLLNLSWDTKVLKATGVRFRETQIKQQLLKRAAREKLKQSVQCMKCESAMFSKLLVSEIISEMVLHSFV